MSPSRNIIQFLEHFCTKRLTGSRCRMKVAEAYLNKLQARRRGYTPGPIRVSVIQYGNKVLMVPGPRPHEDELDSIPRHPEEMLDLIYGGPSDSEKRKQRWVGIR